MTTMSSNTTTTQLEMALRLNNEGIALVLQNKDSAAVQSLTQALTMVKQVLLEPSSTEMIAQGQAPQAQGQTNMMIHDSLCYIPGLQSTDCFLYSGGIVFSNTTTSVIGRAAEQDLNLYSASIILNIAMIYHRQARIYGKRACLDKADIMYDMVSKLVGDSNNMDDDDHQQPDCVVGGTSLLIRLAAINNRSLIHLEQGNYNFGQAGFHHLAAILDAAGDYQVQQLFGQGQQEGTTTSTDNSNTASSFVVTPPNHTTTNNNDGAVAVQGMLLNAFLANPPTAAPAA